MKFQPNVAIPTQNNSILAVKLAILAVSKIINLKTFS